MAKKTASRERRRVIYPDGLFDPKEWLRFIQMPWFERGWSELGMSDDDLRALEMAIMINPTGQPVIKDTGGIRKMRFGVSGTGKRGGARICYVYFPDNGIVLLMTAFAKNAKETLNAAEKRALRKRVEEIQVCLEEGTQF